MSEGTSMTDMQYDAETQTLKYTLGDGTQSSLTKADIVGVLPGKKNDDDIVLYVTWTGKDGQGQTLQTQEPNIQTVKLNSLPQNVKKDLTILLQVEQQPEQVQPPERTARTHVIVSTTSGLGKAAMYHHQLVRPFLKLLGLQEHEDYVVHHTMSETFIGDITKKIFLPLANQGIVQRLILLSGDGGIVDILNALDPARHTARYAAPVLAVFPTGTGNALAHSTGITRDQTGGLATLARGKPRPLPTFKARFSPGARLLADEGRQEQALASDEDGSPVFYGCVVCSWGLHASLVADSDTAEYRKYGAERFKMAAKEALYPSDGSPPHRYRAKVSLLKRDEQGNERWVAIDRPDHAYVLASLVSTLEENFVISPASQPFDGQLRVVHFGHVDGDEFMRLMGLAYQGGKHVEDDIVSYEAVDGLRIDFQGMEKDPRWRRICVDGSIVRVEENGWVEVRKVDANVLKLLSLD